MLNFWLILRHTQGIDLDYHFVLIQIYHKENKSLRNFFLFSEWLNIMTTVFKFKIEQVNY